MRAWAWLLAVFLLVACGQPTEPAVVEPALPVEVRASVDNAVATTGDVITFMLEVDRDPAFEVEIPEAGAEIAGFRIIDLGQNSAPDEGRVVDTWWYKLRADLVGSYVLPSTNIRYRQGEGEWQTIETSEIFVEVASVLPLEGEVDDIRDIKPLQPPRTSSWWILLVAGGVLLLLSIVVVSLAIWWLRRSSEGPRLVPPHEVAFAALDALREVDLDDPEALRAWYFDLSEVLRTYVEGRFGLNATDLTTDEILARMVELKALANAEKTQLKTFLLDTDQVKFAAYCPSGEEIERSYEDALGFVEATVPQEQTEVRG